MVIIHMLQISHSLFSKFSQQTLKLVLTTYCVVSIVLGFVGTKEYEENLFLQGVHSPVIASISWQTDCG